MSTYSQFAGGGGIKSIQRGTLNINSAVGYTSGTATISSVNTSKSVIRWLGATTDTISTAWAATLHTRLELTNSTTVTAYIGGPSGASWLIPVSWEVTEYN